MSATSETLVEHIRRLEQKIKILEEAGADTYAVKEELRILRSKFSTATTALNEGKSILKG